MGYRSYCRKWSYSGSRNKLLAHSGIALWKRGWKGKYVSGKGLVACWCCGMQQVGYLVNLSSASQPWQPPLVFPASVTASATRAWCGSSATPTPSSSWPSPSSCSTPTCTAPTSNRSARWSWRTSSRTSGVRHPKDKAPKSFSLWLSLEGHSVSSGNNSVLLAPDCHLDRLDSFL